MTRLRRYLIGLPIGIAIGLALQVGVAAWAQGSPLPIPAGTPWWMELGATFLDRHWPELVAGGTALWALFKGWRPRMPIVTIRLEVHIPEPVAVRHVRLERQAPTAPVAIEDVSDSPSPEPAPAPVPLRDRNTHPPRRR